MVDCLGELIVLHQFQVSDRFVLEKCELIFGHRSPKKQALLWLAGGKVVLEGSKN